MDLDRITVRISKSMREIEAYYFSNKPFDNQEEPKILNSLHSWLQCCLLDVESLLEIQKTKEV